MADVSFLKSTEGIWGVPKCCGRSFLVLSQLLRPCRHGQNVESRRPAQQQRIVLQAQPDNARQVRLHSGQQFAACLASPVEARNAFRAMFVNSRRLTGYHAEQFAKVRHQTTPDLRRDPQAIKQRNKLLRCRTSVSCTSLPSRLIQKPHSTVPSLKELSQPPSSKRHPRSKRGNYIIRSKPANNVSGFSAIPPAGQPSQGPRLCSDSTTASTTRYHSADFAPLTASLCCSRCG